MASILDSWTNTGEVRCFRCGEIAATRTGGPSADEVGQVQRWNAGVLGVERDDVCLAAVCCWPCFWAFEPDMWIDAEHWSSMAPRVPLEKLPVLDHDNPKAEDPSYYAWPLGT